MGELTLPHRIPGNTLQNLHLLRDFIASQSIPKRASHVQRTPGLAIPPGLRCYLLVEHHDDRDFLAPLLARETDDGCFGYLGSVANR